MSTWRESIAHSRDSALARRAGGPGEEGDHHADDDQESRAHERTQNAARRIRVRVLILDDGVGILLLELRILGHPHLHHLVVLVVEHHERLRALEQEVGVDEGRFRLKEDRQSFHRDTEEDQPRTNEDKVGAKREDNMPPAVFHLPRG